MKLSAKTALYLIALLVCLLAPGIALATDTAPGVALPDGDAARTTNDPRYSDTNKPTTPTTTTKPPTVVLDNAQDSYSEPQQESTTRKTSTTNTTERRSDVAGVSATTTTTKKKTEAESAPQVKIADEPKTQAVPKAKAPVVVKGERVENPAGGETKKRPFDLGIDIKPYLAAFILFGLFITTGNKRYAATAFGARETIVRRRTSFR